MDKRKTWTAKLKLENWNWVKKTADDTGVSGSDLIDELVEREANDKSGRFKARLVQRRIQRELELVRGQKEQAEAKEEELTRQLKGDKISAEA